MDLTAYPRWWPSIEHVKPWTDSQGLLHAKKSVRSRFRHELGWEGVYDESMPPTRASYRLEFSDLLGRDSMNLSDTDGGMQVIYPWEVETTRIWMNIVAQLFRPLFV